VEEGDPGSRASLRDLNRARLVHTLRETGVTSRAELARRTGLSRSTVSSIVAELSADGVIVDKSDDEDTRPRQGGRPPILISLGRPAGVAVGIDFGKRHLNVALADASHRVLAERREPMPDDYPAGAAFDAAAQLVRGLLEDEGIDLDQVLGVGLGLPGPIHRPSGTVGSTAILPGWVGIHVASEMEDRLGLAVQVENDANLGALAEATWGAGEDSENLAYLKLATGIGAGLIVGGRLFDGTGGTAGEIGHTTLDENGEICRCGNRGCLETLAGAPAIVALVSRAFGEQLDTEEVLRRSRAGDPACSRALADAGRHVGVAVADLVNLVNPERIVVGGSIGSAGEVLLGPLRETVGRRAIPSAAGDVEIVSASLGERAELLGAVALVLQGAGSAVATASPSTIP
jgi:predicted NBD/HSP70 family sugar kinase